ncbi:MAG: hypothetical protein RIF39_08920 [Cyclobacteriaceae bacterium]
MITLVTVLFAASFFMAINFDKAVKGIIKKDTSKLSVEDKIIDQFMQDARNDGKWDQFNFEQKLFIKFGYYFKNTMIPFPYKNKFTQYRSFIVRNFLLSTDFFLNKMDSKKKLRYIGLHNPYRRPCSNPFSNGYYNANEIVNGRV